MIRFLLAWMIVFSILPFASLAAQPVDESGVVVAVADPGPQPLDPSTDSNDWYVSSAGIVIATIFVVSGLKRVLGNVPGASSIPTWIYAIGVSLILTVIARQVFGTMPGPFVQVAYQVAFQAAASSGAYEWFHNGGKPLSASAASAGVTVSPKRSA